MWLASLNKVIFTEWHSLTGPTQINEAFASMYVYCVRKLGLDIGKVNVNGGAIALGHPLGATGARQVATGLAELQRRDGKVCVSCAILEYELS